MTLKYFLAALFILSAPVFPLGAAENPNLVVNSSFEEGKTGWNDFWAREPGMGSAEIVSSPAHSGKQALKVQYHGARDWSFSQEKQLDAKPGEIYAFSAWVKCEHMVGAGQGQLSVVTRDSANQVLEWSWAMKNTYNDHDWEKVENKFVVPPGCASIQFRITGWGEGITYWDDLSLQRLEKAPVSLSQEPVTLEDSPNRLVYTPSTRQIAFYPKKGGPAVFQGWGRNAILRRIEKTKPNRLDLTLGDSGGGTVSASVLLSEGDAVFSLKGQGSMAADFEFPGPLLSAAGENWVLPVNEGLYVPCNDPYFRSWDLVLYGGHGLCMPFVGLTNGREGVIAIAETQNDAKVKFTSPKDNQTSSWSFVWEPSQQAWGTERKLLIRPVPKGGYVGIAKAYRAYAKAHGLLKTLKEKAAWNPNVDKLIGAVNLWWWRVGPWWSEDPEADKMAADIKKAGIERVLWSHEQAPACVDTLNQLGYLTGKYDIYQDVWNPKDPVPWGNKEGWPDCLVFLPNGDWMKGWVAREGGKDYPGGVICSTCSLEMEKRKVPEDLKTHAYRARFVDTTTASPMRECYNPKHPLSRTQDRENKMQLLNVLSQDLKLVTGSETGVDMAVPYLHYFEGMMSLGPYRFDDAGYDLFTVKKPTEEMLRFQVGPFYRIPLFELVYHDCVVNYWYWGDSSNRLVELWDARDLFNALYGTGPLWAMDRSLWEKHRERFVKSYRTATAVARQTGYSEMLSHSFLTEDHTVQTTSFADGTKVWVNFGDKVFKFKNGKELKPKGHLVLFQKKDN